jgi:hypothetical protein
MTFPFTVEYSTEGAPLLIGDLAAATYWNGRQYDGGGITLEYFGRGLETMPKEFAQTTKQGGMRKKTFKNPDELAAFESELLKRFKKLHPTAAKPAKYPDYPAYYVGDARVFGMERQFTSPFAMVLKKLKGDVASIPFSKKPKAEALFFDTEGGGPGVIANDPSASAVVVAKITTASSNDHKELLSSLERTALSKLKPKGQIELGDTLVIFDSSRASSDVAQHNWSTPSLAEGLAPVVQQSPHGPIMAPDQAPAGGAFFRIRPGSYNYAVVRDNRAGSVTYNALWLWQS